MRSPDSGPGIIETLRPALITVYPRLVSLSDSQLMREIFNYGLSRFGDMNGGSGLKSCGKWAARFNVSIEIRQNKARFSINTSDNKVKTLHAKDRLPDMRRVPSNYSTTFFTFTTRTPLALTKRIRTNSFFAHKTFLGACSRKISI